VSYVGASAALYSADPMSGRSPRTRVLFVGAETYDLPLAPGLARKWDALSDRMDIRVIARAGEIGAGDSRFRLLRLRSPVAGSYELVLPPVIAAEARRFKPDVVITQSPYEALSVLMVRRALRPSPRVVVEIHGDWRTAARLYGSAARKLVAGLADRAALLALRRADAIRSVSRFTTEIAEQATGRRPLATFPTFLDLASFLEPVRELPPDPAVAWIGQLHRVKAPDVFAEAWRLTAKRVPRARLTMVGDGPLRGVAEALWREFPARVRLERQLPPPEVARVLDESTVLALPSRLEGMPRVGIEAFIRGRPVVGSAVGGIADLVADDRSGLLVPPGDRDRLADALVRVLSDRALAERLAEGAREHAGSLRWSPDRYADAVLELVENVSRPA
jgi:glycosyltransferase involved in cell wall biosynthesis